MKTCPDCNGDGVIDKGTDDEKQCPTCGGSGFVPDDNDDKNNEEVIRTWSPNALARIPKTTTYPSTPSESAASIERFSPVLARRAQHLFDIARLETRCAAPRWATMFDIVGREWRRS
jgi:hypothetical protein